jgi:hypothetical protein
MGISKIDCSVYRGSMASLERSSYRVFSPGMMPANAVFVGAAGVRDGLGSQVAFRLALDHFVEGVVGSETPGDPIALLEGGFRAANQGVYQFGHRLAAGGRLTASVLGAVISPQAVAVGRVGIGTAFLVRRGSVYPFFEEHDRDPLTFTETLDAVDPVRARAVACIGQNSLVDVELASVPVAPGDLVIVSSRFPRPDQVAEASDVIASVNAEEPREPHLRALAREFFVRLLSDPETVAYGLMARVGPETIYLSEVSF